MPRCGSLPFSTPAAKGWPAADSGSGSPTRPARTRYLCQLEPKGKGRQRRRQLRSCHRLSHEPPGMRGRGEAREKAAVGNGCPSSCKGRLSCNPINLTVVPPSGFFVGNCGSFPRNAGLIPVPSPGSSRGREENPDLSAKAGSGMPASSSTSPEHPLMAWSLADADCPAFATRRQAAPKALPPTTSRRPLPAPPWSCPSSKPEPLLWH